MQLDLKHYHREFCLLVLKAQTHDEVDQQLGHVVGQYLLLQIGENKNLETEVDIFKCCANKRREQLNNK